MKNEPVAWIDEHGEISIEEHWAYSTPLYTYPVKELGNPVAWRSKDPDGYWSIYQAPVEGAEPLYTGFNELTNEDIEKNTDYWADKANWIKKNEPVAWMNKIATSWVTTTPDEFVDEWIPLYTHQYERPHNTVLVPCDKLAEMQAEIETLKQIIDTNNLNQNIGQFVKPANEPVAWMVDGVLFTSLGAALNISFDIEQPCIPLYTHPVKDLEDIDINITWNENSMRDFGKDELAFARAILRKAQDK